MSFDLAGFLRLRINEHMLHNWDIAVAFDPAAVLPADGIDVVLEALPLIARFTGKPTGSTKELRIHTTAPTRTFLLGLSAGGITVAADDGDGAPDVELPAEAFVRLVYGRLDSGHTPSFTGAGEDLDELRRAFPGV
jgi:hypothetical protein